MFVKGGDSLFVFVKGGEFRWPGSTWGNNEKGGDLS